MSDKKERTLQVIHQEYSALCAKAGHLQYNISVFKDDLALINQQMKDLNLEAAALPKEVAPAPAAAPAVSSDDSASEAVNA